LDDIYVDDLSAEEKAEWDKAQKKHQRRMLSMLIFCVILVIPVGIGAYKMWSFYRHIGEAQTWAEAELKKAQPDPMAYGDLGSIYLDQGKLEAALPLLAKAIEFEARQGVSAQDHLTYAHAQIQGTKRSLPGTSRELALKALQDARAIAEKLPQGRKAATNHGAGMLYLELGEQQQAIACLSLASQLQKDDWVDEGPGRRYRMRQISGAYAKDLAVALQTRSQTHP
jgi:tetratricopeptide (TPR) repeat protein